MQDKAFLNMCRQISFILMPFFFLLLSVVDMQCLCTYFDFLCYLAISYFQAMTIIAFNNGHIDSKTIRQVLSLGPTFVVMKLFESEILFLLHLHFSWKFHFFLRLHMPF